VLQNSHWEGPNKSPGVYHHEHWRVYQNKWHIQVWFRFCIQKLSQNVRFWCWHLSQEFCGVAETQSIWCKPPEFEIHENLIKCGTIQFLDLFDKKSQSSIWLATRSRNVNPSQTLKVLSQSPQFQNSEDDSKVLDVNNAHDPYLRHHPYVPSIWNCYAQLLLHPVSRIMTMYKQYEHYLRPIPMHSRLERKRDSYCATHCCFKATIELENCKLIKKAFDPCWVEIDEHQHQNRANKFMTVNNVAYSKGSNCR